MINRWLDTLVSWIAEKHFGEDRQEIWQAIEKDLKGVYREGIGERKENTIYIIEYSKGKAYYYFTLVCYNDICYHQLVYYKSLKLLKISKFLRK